VHQDHRTQGYIPPSRAQHRAGLECERTRDATSTESFRSRDRRLSTWRSREGAFGDTSVTVIRRSQWGRARHFWARLRLTHVMLASTCDLLAYRAFNREEIRDINRLGDCHLPQAHGSFKWHVLGFTDDIYLLYPNPLCRDYNKTQVLDAAAILLIKSCATISLAYAIDVALFDCNLIHTFFVFSIELDYSFLKKEHWLLVLMQLLLVLMVNWITAAAHAATFATCAILQQYLYSSTLLVESICTSSGVSTFCGCSNCCPHALYEI
jgi:hypothetical protein